MLVRELIERLQVFDPNLAILKENDVGGYNDIQFVELDEKVLDLGTGKQTKAVVIS